jgi:hypothetical protein
MTNLSADERNHGRDDKPFTLAGEDVRRRLVEVKDILLLDRVFSELWRGEVELVDMRVKATRGGQDPYLVVLRGIGPDGTPLVSFHSGGTPIDALAGAARRVAHGTLKWKIDEWKVNNNG